MGYTLQKLSTPPLTIVKMFAPSDDGDAFRLFVNLDEIVRKSDGEEALYLLFDISSITFSQEFSIAHLIDTIFKLYATWDASKSINAYIVADTSLIAAIHFLLKGSQIPLKIFEDYSDAIEKIEILFADTHEFTGINLGRVSSM